MIILNYSLRCARAAFIFVNYILLIWTRSFYMNFYKLDNTVDRVLKNIPTQEQVFLKMYLNTDFQKKEAENLWKRIADHKWYISERLKRDVGFRVAAIDYAENFYNPRVSKKLRPNLQSSIREFFKIIWRMEFLRPKSL